MSIFRTNRFTSQSSNGAAALRARPGAGPLALEEIRKAAPSIFAGESHNSRSAKYTYIPTSDILEQLGRHGFRPFAVAQGGSRDQEKRGFTKHLVRLRHDSQGSVAVGEEFAEIVLLNSHDGTSSYQMAGGLLRLACLNGLVAGSQVIEEVKIPHRGNILENVVEGCIEILENLPKVMQAAGGMKQIPLSRGEQMAMATAASVARWEDKEAPFEAEKLLQPNRSADRGTDLWTTFNVIQENLIRGGVEYVNHSERNGRIVRERRTTREIKGIDQNMSLNKALWTLAEEMKKLKA